MDLTIRLSGAQGEGVESTGRTVASTFSRMGLHVFTFRMYGSIIKGNPTMFYQVRVSDRKIHSHGPWNSVDVLIALNKNAFAAYVDMARVTIFDSADVKREGRGLIGVPLTEYALKAGNRIMKNTVAVGALYALLGIDLSVLEGLLRREFGDKGEKIVEQNMAAAELGYKHVEEHYGGLNVSFPRDSPKPLISGAEALALGALFSGMKFYAAYPMTPASPLLHFLAEWGPRYGVSVVQAEDEIAAINMAIGASYAGVRAATGTSGGGFSLMHEAVGLAAMIEVPVVVFLGQRGGPSTGLPTETEQADLLMSINPSQGDFPIVVLAPTTIEDGLYTVARAFNIAEKYQVPVMVLTDLYFNESMTTIGEVDWSRFKVERGDLVTSPVVWEEYKRYRLTETGVSPRTVPGVPGGMHIATSDEHDEKGDVITDRHEPKVRRVMMEKRMRKLDYIRREMEPPSLYGSPGARTTLVVWGSTAMPVMDFVDTSQGYNALIFRDLYPLPRDQALKALSEAARKIAVEVNYTGQLVALLRRELGVDIGERVVKYWGEPFSVDELGELMRKRVEAVVVT